MADSRVREFKTFHVETTKIGDDNTVTGIFSVFGNVDSVNDVVQPGSFTKTILERVQKGKVKHLWQHDFSQPPTAVILSMAEIARTDLPASVLTAAPDALGGVIVTRKYLNTARGLEVLEGVKSGAINEMSFGFDAIKFDFVQDDPNMPPVRNLREVRLYDTSDVLWGANDATVAVKYKLPLDMMLNSLLLWIDELKGAKAGSRHSEKDMALLDDIHKAVVQLGSDCNKVKNPVNDNDNDEPVSAYQVDPKTANPIPKSHADTQLELSHTLQGYQLALLDLSSKL